MLRNLYITAIALVLLLLLTPLITLQVLTLEALQRRLPHARQPSLQVQKKLNHETDERNEKEDESPLINADER